MNAQLMNTNQRETVEKSYRDGDVLLHGRRFVSSVCGLLERGLGALARPRV